MRILIVTDVYIFCDYYVYRYRCRRFYQYLLEELRAEQCHPVADYHLQPAMHIGQSAVSQRMQKQAAVLWHRFPALSVYRCRCAIERTVFWMVPP